MLKKTLLLLLVFSCSSIHIHAQNALKYRQLQVQADVFFEKADYTQAIVLYKKMLPISIKPRVENYYIASEQK
jgi:hypothetical protein